MFNQMSCKSRTVSKHVRRISMLTEYIHHTNDVHWELFDCTEFRLPLDTWTSAAVAAHQVDGITAPYELVLDLESTCHVNALRLASAVGDMRRDGHVGMFLSFERGSSYLHRTFLVLLDDQIVLVDSNGASCDLKSRAIMAAYQSNSTTSIAIMTGDGLQQTCKSDSCLVLSLFVWVQVALAWKKHKSKGAMQCLKHVFRRGNHPTVLRQVWMWAMHLHTHVQEVQQRRNQSG